MPARNSPSGACAWSWISCQIMWGLITRRLTDLFTDAIYERGGSEMLSPGLYVDLPPWGYHFLPLCRGNRMPLCP